MLEEMGARFRIFTIFNLSGRALSRVGGHPPMYLTGRVQRLHGCVLRNELERSSLRKSGYRPAGAKNVAPGRKKKRRFGVKPLTEGCLTGL